MSRRLLAAMVAAPIQTTAFELLVSQQRLHLYHINPLITNRIFNSRYLSQNSNYGDVGGRGPAKAPVSSNSLVRRPTSDSDESGIEGISSRNQNDYSQDGDARPGPFRRLFNRHSKLINRSMFTILLGYTLYTMGKIMYN